MKWRVAAVVLVVVVAALLVNALLVTRATRPAEPFASGRVLELDGPDLNVREYGPPGDRAIVLLHGYTASIEWWESVAPELAANGRRVVAIDLVGHGGSEAPKDEAQYTAPGQATAVRRALDALGVRHAVLVGHSMGGSVAVTLAEQSPEVVDRIAVSDTPGDWDLVALPALGDAACWPIVGPLLDRFRGVDAVTDSSLQTGFAADFPVPPLAHRSLERMTYRALCDSKKGPADSIADRLVALKKPVLVVWGERDVLTPIASNVDRYRAAGVDPKVIPTSGHTPLVETPDAFVAEIAGFVAP